MRTIKVHNAIENRVFYGTMIGIDPFPGVPGCVILRLDEAIDIAGHHWNPAELTFSSKTGAVMVQNKGETDLFMIDQVDLPRVQEFVFLSGEER